MSIDGQPADHDLSVGTRNIKAVSSNGGSAQSQLAITPKSESLGGSLLSGFVGLVLTTPVVLTTATDFHHARFLRVLAVFAAILTTLFTRTIACGVLAFIFFLVFRHVNTPCSSRIQYPSWAKAPSVQ